MSNTLSNYSSIMNTYSRFPLAITKGSGSIVWSADGEEYLDFTSGIATCNLGHCPLPVKAALQEQLDSLWHISNLYQLPKQEELANILTSRSCFDQVFFCNSGAEANEAAIKLVKAYENKKTERSAKIITFHQSFHGRTLATVAATGQEKIKTGFEPLPEGFIHLRFNEWETLQAIKEIKPTAVMLELLQGEGGVIPAEPAWIKELAEICKQQDILFIVDEVQTGMGRTGSLFLYEQYGIEPDIMTLAKGLGSGFPIGAMLAKGKVASTFQPGMHGSTFGGNPLACSAAIATLTEISPDFLDASNQTSKFFLQELEKVSEKFPNIIQVRGIGFLIGLEVAGDALPYVKAALQEKLLILSAGKNVIRILPPINVSKKTIQLFLGQFIKVLHMCEEV
ncbi:aspartate aminotransferase family protein [Sutcliffiella rhizosphaerae]|uniref:Acetylornithine aminotransferase n=1 Tax=Sutcliffiella rhizosphaerae TaxID=2880967 RepID=A0ABN8A946_9BACI|nr:aspartate aminotransferase family protein [Sutcliffiella rhizosphaerae]CAG9621658.1 Acetylornithine aminotransferase [Sutcliffiella rhizosphaerae]